MKNPIANFWYALSLLLLVPMAQAAPRDLPDFSRLVDKHGAAVVNISTTQRLKHPGAPKNTDEPDAAEDHPFNDYFRRYFDEGQESFDSNPLGSGFIVSPDGYILTCAHVVEDAREIVVRLTDRREYSAKLIGSDKRSDIALLKIDATGLPAVVIGEPGRLLVGEWVLAIGSPFGFDSSATSGIVSAKTRALPNENYVSFIQTDVAINPGNSGGPLFNLKGEVVGINSQIYSRTGGFMGLSFAIPIDAAMKITTQLKSQGHVRRGWLGVSLQEVSRTLASAYGLNKPHGALVADILPTGPAAKSELRSGDIVLEYEGKAIDHSSDLPPLVGLTAPGTQVRLTVFRRDRSMQNVMVALGELKEEVAAKPSSRQGRAGGNGSLGMALGEISPVQRKTLNLDYGVAVEVVDEGPARDAGLRTGDVILEVDGKRVYDISGFQRLTGRGGAGKLVVLRVRRGASTSYLALSTGG